MDDSTLHAIEEQSADFAVLYCLTRALVLTHPDLPRLTDAFETLLKEKQDEFLFQSVSDRFLARFQQGAKIEAAAMRRAGS